MAAFFVAGCFFFGVAFELKIACKDANNSSVLKPLLTPISLVVTEFTALEQKLKGGSFSTSDLTGAGAAIDGLQQKSTSAGFPRPNARLIHIPVDASWLDQGGARRQILVVA